MHISGPSNKSNHKQRKAVTCSKGAEERSIRIHGEGNQQNSGSIPLIPMTLEYIDKELWRLLGTNERWTGENGDKTTKKLNWFYTQMMKKKGL